MMFDPAFPHCVYAHSRRDVVFYVGMGSLRRAFDLVDRTPTWKAVVGKEPFEINIIGFFATDADACKAERAAIEGFRPIANVMKGSDIPKRRPKVPRTAPLRPAGRSPIRDRAEYMRRYRARNSTECDGPP